MMRSLLIFALLCVVNISLAEDVHKLSVSGNASIYKEADKLNLTIGVETTDKDVNQAMRTNAEKMKAVLASLNKLGLGEKDLQTKEYTISPVYTPSPKNPPENWQPSISGYLVRNTLDIHTDKLNLSGEIIDTVGKQGGNLIQHISFTLKDEQQAKAEAIAQAFQQAEEYAKAAAKAAGVKLGDIIDLSINNPYVSPKFFNAERMALQVATPIVPHDVEVTATVSVVFAIQTP